KSDVEVISCKEIRVAKALQFSEVEAFSGNFSTPPSTFDPILHGDSNVENYDNSIHFQYQYQYQEPVNQLQQPLLETSSPNDFIQFPITENILSHNVNWLNSNNNIIDFSSLSINEPNMVINSTND
ncbi:2427_t:CDS:1, partial [Dentiscutata erythropus]